MFELIINDIYMAFLQYAPLAMLSGGVLVMILYFPLNFVYKKKHLDQNRLWRTLVLSFVLYSYCFIVVSITLLSREQGSRDSLDLLPFSTFSKVFWDNRYPIENVLLFIPLGILLPLLYPRIRKLTYILAMGFGLSMLIELTQYVTKRGFFQTDDIMTNVMGTAIGYVLILGFLKISNNFCHNSYSDTK